MAILLVGCAAGEFERNSFSRVRMGTRATIVTWSSLPPDRVQAAADAAFERIAALEAETSDYLVDGLVQSLRQAQPGNTQLLPCDLVEVLRVAAPVVEASDGAFDPACGRLTAHWRAVRAGGADMPDEAAVHALLAGSGWDRLGFDAAGGTITPQAPVPWLDFGGVAKGMAADLAADKLVEDGIDIALVDLGGDLALRGAPPGRRGWSIGQGEDVLLLQGPCGVATSGATAQFMMVQGQRWSHIIDPRTGWPVEGERVVTVIAPTCALADAWASAGSVLAPALFEAIIKQQPGIRLPK